MDRYLWHQKTFYNKNLMTFKEKNNGYHLRWKNWILFFKIRLSPKFRVSFWRKTKLFTVKNQNSAALIWLRCFLNFYDSECLKNENFVFWSTWYVRYFSFQSDGVPSATKVMHYKPYLSLVKNWKFCCHITPNYGWVSKENAHPK